MTSDSDIKICQELNFMKIFKMIRGFFLKRSRSCKNHAKRDISCQTLIPDLKRGSPEAEKEKN